MRQLIKAELWPALCCLAFSSPLTLGCGPEEPPDPVQAAVFFVDDEDRKYAGPTGALEKGILRLPAGKNLAFELRRPLPQGKTTVKASLPWVAAGGNQAPKSKNGNYTAIIFENKSGRPVNLVWVSYDGDLQAYGQLAPGATRTQNTYSNNTWLITDQKDKHLGYFIATPQVSKALIPAPK